MKNKIPVNLMLPTRFELVAFHLGGECGLILRRREVAFIVRRMRIDIPKTMAGQEIRQLIACAKII